MRIDGVELGRFDQGVGDGRGFAASLGTDEEIVLPPKGYGAHAAFGGVVVQFQDAVVEVGAQAFHAGQGIADGGGERGFARDRGELHGQPDLQVVEDRGRMCSAKRDPDIWWRPSGFLLDGIELRDPADGLFGDRGALRPVNVDELAPDMGHAGDFSDGAGPIEILEPGIAIGMHPTTEAGEMVLRVPGTGAVKKAWLWAYARDDSTFGGSGPPMVAYRFEDKILHGQQVFGAGLHPVARGRSLTLGAVPVLTTVIGDVMVAALGATGHKPRCWIDVVDPAGLQESGDGGPCPTAAV